MATFKLNSIDEAREKCIELLEHTPSIRISIGFIFEWYSLQDDRTVVTQESMPAVSLDEEIVETGEWEHVWTLLYEQVAAIAERNAFVSGLSFGGILEVRLNWIAFQERSTRGENARGVESNGRSTRNNNTGNVEEESRSTVEVESDRALFVHQLFYSYGYSRGESLSAIRRMGRTHLETFRSQFGLQHLDGRVANASNIAELCSSLHGISVFVYNRRTHIIFQKEVEQAVYACNLYWNGSKMLVIKNMARFMGIHSQQGTYCHNCNRVHTDESGCRLENIELGKFEQPMNKDGEEVKLNMYCDIEAMCPERASQEACCFSLVMEQGRDITVIERSIKSAEAVPSTQEASDELMYTLFKEVEACIGAYFGWPTSSPVKDFTECIWCGNKKHCIQMRRVVVARNEEAEVGFVCHSCYKNWQINRLYQPVIYFHNFSKYDICFVIRHLVHNYHLTLAGRSTELVYNISCSEKNLERHISFRIRDSLHFIQGSISAFAKQVPEATWRNFDSVGPYYNLFLGNKGEFPYEWLQRREQLAEPFPDDSEPRRNKLTGHEVRLDQLRLFCEERGIGTAGEYLQKYCTVDVLILLFYFDHYRKTILAEYNVDVSLFYSISAVSWYLAMRHETECQVPQTIEDYLTIRDNIRGGVAQAIKRYVDTEKGNVVKMLDVNALYSWCMMQALPTKHLSTVKTDDADWLQRLQNKPSSETWLCLVDLEYPQHLHDVHMHFFLPLAPHHFNSRLCTTFLPKTNYLVLDQLLLFYIEQGLVVTRWHSVQRWSNRPIFKQFVEDNISARNASDDNTIKNVRKITNNSLYGKTCENVFRYKQFVVDNFETSPAADGRTNVRARNWLNFTLIDGNFVVAEIARKDVILNKPIQLGFAILELAKLRIYEFWLRLCRIFNTDVELLYTDTDSLLLSFNHPDPFSVLRTHPQSASFVDLPVAEDGSELPAAKTAGLFSDELRNKTVAAYVGLRAKSYIIKFADNTEKRRTKGVRHSALHNNSPLDFDLFRESLFDDRVVSVQEFSIRKKNYHVRVEGGPRKALSNHDAKHQYTTDVVLGFPWGYSGEESLGVQ